MPLTPETAPPETFLAVFADLIDPFLLEADDASTLWELIPNLPDDANAIASSLKAWCQQRPEIFEALKDDLGSRGPNEEVPAAKSEDYKTLLKNKLRESFPETTQKPEPEPPKNQSGSSK